MRKHDLKKFSYFFCDRPAFLFGNVKRNVHLFRFNQCYYMISNGNNLGINFMQQLDYSSQFILYLVFDNLVINFDVCRSVWFM